MATAGAVPGCDCTGGARSTAPPHTPAVPTSIVRRNTERQRTVFSVIAFPPNFSWFEPAGAAADRGHSTGAAGNWHSFAAGYVPVLEDARAQAWYGRRSSAAC